MSTPFSPTRQIAAAILASSAMTTSVAQAAPSWTPLVLEAQTTHAAVAPPGRENWYGFSPDGIGMPLVLYGIYSAHESVHVLAYLLTNREIIAALAEKARQHVSVSVVVDYGESITKDRTGYIRSGLAFLQSSGAQVCATSAFRLMHDKSMVIDRRSVQTGSINYTESAEKLNSEDAVIAWNDVQEAAGFEHHFQSRLATCQPVQN